MTSYDYKYKPTHPLFPMNSSGMVWVRFREPGDDIAIRSIGCLFQIWEVKSRNTGRMVRVTGEASRGTMVLSQGRY